MPPTVAFKIPRWADPQQASVLDSPLQKAARTIGQFLGVDNPVGQVMAVGMPIETPSALKIGPAVALRGEEGFVYHATSRDRLTDIAESGALKTHKPWEFTDQTMWPDGSTAKRAYFGASPEHLWQFAPDHDSVIIRTPKTPAILRESTGDMFTTKPIASQHLQFLGQDGQWHPVDALKSGK